MSQSIQSNPSALVESVARNLPPSARDDFRNLMNETVLANLTALSPGGNLLQIGGVKAGSSAPPVGVTHSVAGANTQLSVSISNPPTPQGQPIAGITRKCEPAINEFWRLRFTGNKQPGDWVSLKAVTPYVIPFTVGRDSGDR